MENLPKSKSVNLVGQVETFGNGPTGELMADICRKRADVDFALCCHKQSFLGSRVYGDIVNVPASAADYPKRNAGEYVGGKRLLGDGNLHVKSQRWMTFV